jgi:hypothetical protein
MPKAFCRACFTFSRVDSNQVGQLVVCPACRSKFGIPRPIPPRPNPVFVGIGLLAIAAVCLVVLIKVQKGQAMETGRPTSRPPASSTLAAPTDRRESAHDVIRSPGKGPDEASAAATNVDVQPAVCELATP